MRSRKDLAKGGRRKGWRRADAGGSALIVVLWTVGLLSLFVGSFAFDAHIESRITSYYRKRTKADYLAISGLELAKWLIAGTQDLASDPGEDDPWDEVMRQLVKGFAVRDLVVVVTLNDDEIALSIEKEDDNEPDEGIAEIETAGEAGTVYGKTILSIDPKRSLRNINNLNSSSNDVSSEAKEQVLVENLEGILDVANVHPDIWTDYIDPFIDWIDPDDESRDIEAETLDWYDTLEPRYRAKNGPLETIDELRLIRNFTNEIVEEDLDLDSDDRPPRTYTVVGAISPLLTVYGDGKVNVNSAGEPVLSTLPGMDPEAAVEIVRVREELDEITGKRTPYKDWADLNNRVADIDPSFQEYLSYVSGVYEVTSAGEVHGVRKTIWCVVEFDSQAKKLKIRSWSEEQ